MDRVSAGWRRLDSDEIDHEQIWGWITLVGFGIAALWLRLVGLPPLVCPFHAVIGLPCLTCGATRALAALLDGRFAASARMNPFVIPAAGVAAVYVPYAIAASALKLPRLRVQLSNREWIGLRWLVGCVAATGWLLLIADGR